MNEMEPAVGIDDYKSVALPTELCRHNLFRSRILGLVDGKYNDSLEKKDEFIGFLKSLFYETDQASKSHLRLALILTHSCSAFTPINTRQFLAHSVVLLQTKMQPIALWQYHTLIF